MIPPRSRADIYTIGHSNAPAARVVALLREQQIDLLVDVRSIPASRYAPQFNRRAFVRTMAEAGVRYAYMGDWLGGRPRDPACYKDGILPRGHADYLNLVDYRMKKNDVQRLVDIRLRPTGQLSGFTKCDDLAYFLPNLINCEYHYTPSLAPIPDVLSTYRKNGDWAYLRWTEQRGRLLHRQEMPLPGG